MSRLPIPLLKIFTLVTLIVELVGPFLIFGPRRARVFACAAFIALQSLIALTGNYAFFNLLTIALSLLLLDDCLFERIVRLRRGTPVQGEELGRGRRILLAATAWVTVPISLLMLSSSIGVELPGWWVVAPVASFAEPFRSVNGYGLFAVMTTTRPEIVMEGSDDGTSWREYEFKYQPTDPHDKPPWVAPHQPRLDWQMWFAALGHYEGEAWFQNFCVRLLQAAPDVLRLLRHDPFDGRPPRFIRGVIYEYRFSDDGRRCYRLTHFTCCASTGLSGQARAHSITKSAPAHFAAPDAVSHCLHPARNSKVAPVGPASGRRLNTPLRCPKTTASV
jgi:hypothetical protein